MVDSSQPSLGPYILLIFGIPITMAIVGKLLFGLDHVYARVTGQDSEVQFRAPWLKSMRGEAPRPPAGSPCSSALTMIVSVTIALLGFGVWFLRLRRLEPAGQLDGPAPADRPEQRLGDAERVDDRQRLLAQLGAEAVHAPGDRLGLWRRHAAVLEVPAALLLDRRQRIEVAER